MRRWRLVSMALLVVAVAQLVTLVAIAVALWWLGITVTVANAVEVANPVETVEVSAITSVVQVAVPNQADLYGYCYKQGRGYDISISAITGGLEQTVAKGLYSENAASAVGLYAAHYYTYDADLDFGVSSEECAQLAGWR